MIVSVGKSLMVREFDNETALCNNHDNYMTEASGLTNNEEILHRVEASMQASPEGVQKIREEAKKRNTAPIDIALRAIDLGSPMIVKDALSMYPGFPKHVGYNMMARASHNQAETAKIESGPTSRDYIQARNWEALYRQAASLTTPPSSSPQPQTS